MRTFTAMQISRLVGFFASFRGWLDSNEIKFFMRSGRGIFFKLEEIKRGLDQTWPSLVWGTTKRRHGLRIEKTEETWTIYSTLFAIVRFGIINNTICIAYA